ncbi:MAG: serine acetyltransferase [Acidobacteriaceae bacterium]
MKLWQTIRADLYRCGGSAGFRGWLREYLRTPGFRYTFYLRKVTYYSGHKRGFGLLPYLYNRLWLNHYRFRYGFEISPLTKIGPGFYMGHFGGVVISPFAVLGSNVNIAQGVTIGAASRGARRGAPTLGNQVWVGANAVIVGRVTIGDDALIGPGAYVNFDVPEKSIVIGNPGQIVSQSGSMGYINNTLEEAKLIED